MKGNKFAGYCLALLLCVAPSVSAAAAELPESLVPVGRTVGIRLDMDGVMIVGFAPASCESGEESPAQRAGLLPGDVIRSFNGREIDSAAEFLTEVSGLDGGSVELVVERGGRNRSFEITPAPNGTEGYQLGIWLRDGVSGIGTLTYYDPETGGFGALGHGIGDVGTEGLIPISSGCITEAEIVDVIRGGSGTPGELCGSISDRKCGEIVKNTDSGIFGSLSQAVSGTAIPVAEENELHLGEAVILSNVRGTQVDEYSVEICRIYHGSPDGRCFMLSIQDPELLELTGGIVQGMSGSPVIQDGKLVGAVTHVCVNL